MAQPKIGRDQLGVGTDLGEYTIGTLPSASAFPNCWALVTDGGSPDVRTVVRSNGTDWKVIAVEGATIS